MSDWHGSWTFGYTARMRLLLGLVMLIVGLGWSVPGAFLLWHQVGDGLQLTQTGPDDFLIVDKKITALSFLGKPISTPTACAISFLPGIALVALGLSALFSDNRCRKSTHERAARRAR